MKTLLHTLSITLITLIFSACSGASQFDNTEKPDATGSVMRMTDIYYVAADRAGEIKKTVISTGLAYEYDEDGRITSQTVYGSKGKISWITVYEYDGKGRMTRIIERQPDEDDVVCPVTEDGNRRVISMPDGTTVRQIEGNTMSEYENDKLIAEYTYDEKGRIILQEDLEDNDIQTFEYDDRGLCHYCLSSEGEDWDSEVKLVDFDAHGNWTKAYMYYRGEIIFVRERTLTYWN